ncbi:hypothetical protein ACHAXS_013872 [Conticribra weissflogii]
MDQKKSQILVPLALSRPLKSSSKSAFSRSNIALSIIVTGIFVLLINHWWLAVHLFVSDAQQGHVHSSLNSFLRDYSGFSTDTSHRSDDPYILSPFCNRCFRSKYDNNRACVEVVNEKQQQANISAHEAAKQVSHESENCKICDPNYCLAVYFNGTQMNPIHDGLSNVHNNYHTKYWRFDRSRPKFTSPTTLTLPSIPKENRIPPQRFKNISSYFIEKYESSSLGYDYGIDFLVEYNPGLAVLPPKMKKKLPKEAVYLLSLRVTPANNCFPQGEYKKLPNKVWEAVLLGMKNHLGLALLDEKYRILPGYDVVIQLDTQIGLKRTMKEYKSPTFMDYRLFVLNGELYLHANVDTVAVSKLDLRARGFGDSDGDNKSQSIPPVGWQGNERFDRPYKLQNLYGGDLLEVTLQHQFITIWSGGHRGKNFALFSIPNATHPGSPDSIYVEINITPEHHVQQVLPDEYDQLTLQQVFELMWKTGTKKKRHANIDKIGQRSMKIVGNMTKSDESPDASFYTTDQYWFPGKTPFKVNSHGGACCVSFSLDDINVGGAEHNHHEPLLVGIAHTKVPWQPWYGKDHIPQERKDMLPHTHYVSFFYAFDPRPPFQLRARSGYFCLGYAPVSMDGQLAPTEGGIFNQHSILTRDRPLKQHNVTYECPQVEYISAFVEKADDQSSTVVGYGMNDCTARLVEIDKREIVRLLYPNPLEMVFEAGK